MKNNVTIIGINYYPEDSAIGLYTTQKAEYLVSKGFNVTVITGFPYYPQWEIRSDYKSQKYLIKEKISGVSVLRSKQYVPKDPTFSKRIIHLISFTFGNFINLFRLSKPDIVISIIPFTTSALLGWFLKLRYKSKLWIHIQDFEFDAALQTGVGNKKTRVFSMLFKMEKWLFSKADIVSTISKSMLSKLGQKTETEKYYLPNWIDEKSINPETALKHKYLKSNKFKILYSGNIGDKQDWKLFIKFCEVLEILKYEIIIVGDGSKKEWLVNEIKNLKNVLYYPPVPYSELSDLLCSADLHILFQKTNVLDTVMPSKVLGMMASAKPSLVIGNEFSEVKTIFEESQGGLYFSKFSTQVIKEVDEIFEHKEKASQIGKNARAFIIDKFSKDKILSNMLNQINMM